MRVLNKPHRVEIMLSIISVFIGILFFPRDVLAWGPVAHIDFSLQLLAGAAALAPTINRLIQKHHADFIYGSLAADSVVGKNFAPELSHCHSWSVAHELLADAQRYGERCEAFIRGYFSHLGADVVAHNHFVPERLVAHYRAKGVGHLYWEARFDQRLLKYDAKVRDAWRDLSKLSFSEHDRFLAERLKPTLFSHRLSTSLYRRSLGVQRKMPWRGTLSRIDSRSKLPLCSSEVERWRVVSVAMAAMALNKPTHDGLRRLDPVGRVALEGALSHRRILRRRHPGWNGNVWAAIRRK
ncbi:MAG: zinc dependent phospholipase C family protein [Deltaproteobacteria bacterium]|nr:zinc dependent phospholipase C family protein [Deltaproteobacteria bacterium]